jgi:hypothetical protein
MGRCHRRVKQSININNGVSQYSLPASNISVVAVGDGKVVYNKNNTTWVWQPSKEPYQLFAFVINQPKFDKATGMLYFTTGTENSLYRIKLPIDNLINRPRRMTCFV